MTLIEVFVVVAIVAIVAAILFGVIGSCIGPVEEREVYVTGKHVEQVITGSKPVYTTNHYKVSTTGGMYEADQNAWSVVEAGEFYRVLVKFRRVGLPYILEVL